ncbi:hypothetical protein A2Z67_03990 [Candidatus Woesebacteria bacterium RBG_13_36_22]|uniref:Uncharacterized protein n=1 Tax=Candidatus Woesebacteria bacterium RBG_13_36_22 TaxID=1802478 RepID=A0A1F7X4V6_9BACT|nr:MAG: hypothetical protein A2Z67_03990 [Candidatus Woesebacteria bacterium RBG_13_36_22]
MFNLKENKTIKILILSIVLIAFVLVLASFQFKVTEVSAQVIAVIVQGDHLSFGAVFPGEELEGNLLVSYVEQEGQDGVNYVIILGRKLLPLDHPEYPSGGDPEMPGYYRNLCPFLTLTKVSAEEEGDTENNASVGLADPSDAWIVYFKVPAIVGYVAQDHINGVVTSNGEYGCDISIDIP